MREIPNSRMNTACKVLQAVIVTLMLTTVSTPAPAASASEKTKPRVLAPRNPLAANLGKECKRTIDDHPGIEKEDACGRFYCGRADVKDITEVWPTFSKDMKCTWQLEGAHCKCRPAKKPQAAKKK